MYRMPARVAPGHTWLSRAALMCPSTWGAGPPSHLANWAACRQVVCFLVLRLPCLSQHATTRWLHMAGSCLWLSCGLLSTGACKSHTATRLMAATACLQGRKLVAGDVLLLAPLDAGAIAADLSIPDPWLPSYRGQPWSAVKALPVRHGRPEVTSGLP